MKLVAYMIVLVVAVVASRSDIGPLVFCGRALAEARVHYCFGSQVIEHSKRDDKMQLTSNVQSWPWLADRMHSMSKRIPGLVNECCLKPCYVSQILSYC